MDHNTIRSINYSTGEVIEIDRNNRAAAIEFLKQALEWLENNDTVTIVTNHHEVMFEDLLKYIK